MKKFKFYALAFAAIAFAGCSDDVIDGKGGNNGRQGAGTPAYLTISFTANGGNSSRSTADDANNTGDKDGNAEDSGHSTPGTKDEVAIRTALVVVYSKEGKQSFAKLYGSTDFSTTTPAAGDGFVITDVNSQSYVSAAPIEVETGTYQVLVVINPVSSLTSGFTTSVSTTDNATVKALYDKIQGEAYSNAAATGYADAADDMGNSTDGFMMTNKEESNVTLTSDNTQAQPGVATVTVERTLSKVTYRTTNEKNIYPVEVNTGSIEARTVTGAISDGGANYIKATLNVAVDSDKPQGNVVYAYYTGTEGNEVLTGVYKQRSGETQVVNGETLTVYEEVEATTENLYDAMEDTEKANYFVAVDFDGNTTISDDEIERSLILQGDEGTVTSEPDTWYVQLKAYALVNLSKSVNYVRHTTLTSDDATGTVFGALTGSNFLWTPYWAAKNAVSLETATITGADTWFYNTLANVSAESQTLTTSGLGSATYYKALPSGGGEAVTGDGTQHGTPLPTTGATLGYCFENSTDIAHQIHGLSTGISFMAEIYEDESCTIPLSTPLYRYAGHLYTGLDKIQEAYGASTPQAIKDLIDKGESATDADFKAANVVKYNGNTCYYYTTEIKHFDNNDPTALGNMEFAIMRNNIYSLAVTSIKEIGDPFVDPTPNMPNESDEAYISINTVMEPWIVRYNDIEF